MHSLSSCVVLGCTACAILGSWGYFRRYPVSRPPVGVLTLTDLMLMMLFILLGFRTSAFIAVIAGLVLYNGAVFAEIIRAGST